MTVDSAVPTEVVEPWENLLRQIRYLHLESLHQDRSLDVNTLQREALRIVLREIGPVAPFRRFAITFTPFIVFQVSDEAYLGWKLHRFRIDGCSMFKIKQSEWYASLRKKNPSIVTGGLSVEHYLIVTDLSIIEVISKQPPEILELEPTVDYTHLR